MVAELSGSSDTPPSLLPTIGWREWVSLGDLAIRWIKAKVDTGAKTSCLHAFDIDTYQSNGREHVRFKVHPFQRSSSRVVPCEAPIQDVRLVRSSNGDASERYVIVTTLKWNGFRWPIDLTLADRSQMRFRMLIGRDALCGKAIVNPEASFAGGLPKRRKS